MGCDHQEWKPAKIVVTRVDDWVVEGIGEVMSKQEPESGLCYISENDFEGQFKDTIALDPKVNSFHNLDSVGGRWLCGLMIRGGALVWLLIIFGIVNLEV